MSSRFTKYWANYYNDGANGFHNVLDSKDVKPWRDPYQPYFSKAAITRLEPLIHNRIKKFLSVLDLAASVDKPIDLSMGYRSLTSDVITSYIFGDNGFEVLNSQDFRSPSLEASEQVFEFVQWSVYFPRFMRWLTRQLQKLSTEQAEKFVPPLAATNWITEVRGTRRFLQYAALIVA